MCVPGHWGAEDPVQLSVFTAAFPRLRLCKQNKYASVPGAQHTPHTCSMWVPCNGRYQPKGVPCRPPPPPPTPVSQLLLTSAAEVLPVGATEERKDLLPARKSRFS